MGTTSGASTRRVVDAEHGEERTPLREIEARDREKAVRRLEAAVVRVHRDPARDLVRAPCEMRAVRGLSVVGLGLAGQPHEILELHRHRRGEK